MAIRSRFRWCPQPDGILGLRPRRYGRWMRPTNRSAPLLSSRSTKTSAVTLSGRMMLATNSGTTLSIERREAEWPKIDAVDADVGDWRQEGARPTVPRTFEQYQRAADAAAVRAGSAHGHALQEELGIPHVGQARCHVRVAAIACCHPVDKASGGSARGCDQQCVSKHGRSRCRRAEHSRRSRCLQPRTSSFRLKHA